MAIELFKVTCVTCQASLSVRNAALVGQIVACPKCNSMVEIAPPVEPAPVAPVVAAVSLKPAQPAFEEPIEEAAGLATEPAGIGSVLDSATAASNVNFIMWSVASFVIGATLTGLFLVLRAGSSDEQMAAAQPAISIAAKAPVSESIPTAEGTPAPITDSPQPQRQAAEPRATTLASEGRGDTPEADATLLGPIEEPVEEEVTANTTPVTAEEVEPQPRLVISQPQTPGVARKFDPLALDPEQLDLNAVTEAAAAEEAPREEAAAEMEIIQEQAPPVKLPVRVHENARGLSGTRSANVQLRRKLPSLVVKDMPVLDLLSLASQLAGVPVSVAPEQLQMAGITPGKPVSVDLKSTTLADALNATLNPLHLVLSADGPQVVILRQEADKVRDVEYPVDDLLGGQLAAADVAKWMEQLIAPESWQGRGGDGRISISEKVLTIEQSQVVQYQVLFFLERIRLAKGKPLRSRYPERLLTAKPLLMGIADRLNAPTTFTFSHETPLAEVFHHWQGEIGMPIFVDWPVLATEDLWPDTLVTCASANEPWSAALDKILAPLGLGWRPAPGGAIQITSRARVETEPQLEIYPVGAWRGDAGDGVVINDPVNKLTYVRASAAAHREHSLAVSR